MTLVENKVQRSVQSIFSLEFIQEMYDRCFRINHSIFSGFNRKKHLSDMKSFLTKYLGKEESGWTGCIRPPLWLELAPAKSSERKAQSSLMKRISPVTARS